MKTVLIVLAFIALSVMLFALVGNNIKVAVIAFITASFMAVFTGRERLILFAISAVFMIAVGFLGLWLFNYLNNGTYPIQSYSLESEQRSSGSLLFGVSSRKHEILHCNVIENGRVRAMKFDTGVRKRFYIVKTTDSVQTLVISPDVFTLYVISP